MWQKLNGMVIRVLNASLRIGVSVMTMEKTVLGLYVTTVSCLLTFIFIFMVPVLNKMIIRLFVW